MRRKIVAGNWKMNLDFQEAQDLVEGIANLCEEKQPDCDIIICPPFPYLEMTSDMADDTQYFYVGAQNVNDNDSGAYTGEVSAKMLDSLGTQFCIVGHSERRKYYNEDNALLAVKINKHLDKSNSSSI